MRRISETHLAFILALGLGMIVIWLITTDLGFPAISPAVRVEARVSQ